MTLWARPGAEQGELSDDEVKAQGGQQVKLLLLVSEVDTMVLEMRLAGHTAVHGGSDF